MFGLFRKKQARLLRESDCVYASRERADHALVEAALELCAQSTPVIVASFFRGSLARIQAALAREALEPRWVEPPTLPSLPLPRTSKQPLLLGVASMSVDHGLSSWLLRAEVPFRVLFVEHYPTFEAERNVLEVLEECSAREPLCVRFHVGLDEPFMSVFGGSRISSLMESMGMTPGEKIEHPMVDKSIINAQKKLGRRVPSPQPADTDREWFALNVSSS